MVRVRDVCPKNYFNKNSKIIPDEVTDYLISPRLEGTIFFMTKKQLLLFVKNEGEIIQDFINNIDLIASKGLLNIYIKLLDENLTIDRFYIIKKWLESHGAQYYSLKILPEYKWVSCIGKGSFSNAHLIKTFNNYKKVLKITKNSYLNKNNYKLFLREMSILQQLNHPYIIKLYKYDTTNEYIYWSLNDYCNLGSLDNLFKRHTICSNVLRLRFFEQIIEALSYIHNKGIIHRDIKPANIFMTGEDLNSNYIIFKIGDFNLSRFLVNSPNEDNLTICGTRNYMAPELLLQSEYNHKIDVWGLLCVYIRFSLWNNEKKTYKLLDKQLSEKFHIKNNISNMTTYEIINKLNDYTEFEHTLILKMHHVNPNKRASTQELKYYFTHNKPNISFVKRPRSFTL